MIRSSLALFVALPVVTAIACDGLTDSDARVYKLHGLNFSPYVEGQDPALRSRISEDQLTRRLRIVAPYTEWVRTFGTTDGLEHAGRIAHELGLKTAVGAWLGRDLAANEQQIASLIAVAEAGHVDIAVVGNEVLLRNELSENQLIGYISRVREAIPPSIPVTTAEVCGLILAHPAVLDAVDVVFANHYAYWEGIKLPCAVHALRSCYAELVAAASTKPVVISETGWPSCGNTIGEAEPSPENASTYFQRSISWARANDVPLFYFGAFDESWKARDEGPQGACWGLWDKDGKQKPGVEPVFRKAIVTDDWDTETIPGGPGTPSIEFTFVPEYGSFENLRGQVRHLRPADYRVAVYIYVSGWWTKPYWNRPATRILCDGSWICDITTGGVDQRATRIAAFVLPAHYDPPLMRGDAALPQELFENAVAQIEVERSP